MVYFCWPAPASCPAGACASAVDAPLIARQSAAIIARPAILRVRFIPSPRSNSKPIHVHLVHPGVLLPGIKLVLKLWDYRKSARKSARRYSTGTYVFYIVGASRARSHLDGAPRSLRLNVKMSFAQKGSPKERRIVMAGISKTNKTTEASGPLTGRVALVTGGSRGIGRAIAIKLAGLGVAVAICGRDAEKLRATADELHAVSEKSFWQTADVTRAGDVEKLVSDTEKQLGPIGILVNNAGIGLFAPAHEKKEEERSEERRVG